MTGPNPTTDSPDQHHHSHSEPNEFGKLLNKGAGVAKPYTNQLLAGGIAFIVVLAGAMFWLRGTHAQNTVGWDEFAVCRAPEDYQALADKYPTQPVGQAARLQAGRQYLREGLEQSLTNRAVSDERIKQAKDAFDALLKPGGSPQFREEALYGFATSLEALSDGNDKTAIEAYEQLLKDYPESQHRLWVNTRIAALKSPNAEGFYAWFRKQNPKPADRPTPQDSKPASPDDIFKDLQLPTGSGAPAAPAGEMKIELPKLEGEAPKAMPADKEAPAAKTPEKAPAMPAPAPEKPAEMPAETKPAAEKPAAEKPAEAKPEAGKPATEKPAEEKAPEKATEEKKPESEKPATEEAKPAAEAPAEK
ncbi:hypothetical protein [Planctomicrobium sp. SH527]|uniref:tetratricopeptide repeat protein n=1 Tax=Planctomicrobium sp. SH527 TaxID=3448123 RepID=UPI003F5B85D7